MVKLWNFLKRNTSSLIDVLLAAAILTYLFYGSPLHKENTVLKEYKDGIQNHLTWDIKGQCYFVRPTEETTVYLIRVTDCDRK